MSFREISEDTLMENGDSNFSNADALIFGSADISVGNASMISGPNMSSSSSSSFMSVDHHLQQSMSLSAGGGDDDDDELIVSTASSRILNDDFEEFTSVAGSDIDGDGKVNKETSNMLVQISVACFEAIQQKNLNLADALLTDLRNFGDSEIGEMKNVATDFAQALGQMINQTPKPRSLKFNFLRKSYREMSINTSTEEDSDSFDSNTDAIIYGVYDDSGSGDSLISDPNIPSSSSSSSDEDDDFLQQQMMISTAAVGTNDLIEPTSASFSWLTSNKEIHEPKAIMIFNVDFRALSSGVNNEIEGLNLKLCGKRVREEETEVFLMNKEMRREQMVYPLTLTPSNWSSIWDYGDGNGIFDVPPLSPLTSSNWSSIWDGNGNDAIIFGSADISGGDTSMISGPNMASSSSSSYWSVDHHQQQVSTAAGGGDDNDTDNDDELIVSAASSRIINDDFRAFTSVVGSELGLRLNTGNAKGVNNEASNMLVQISIACFEAIQQNNLNLAEALVTDLRKFADSQIGDMKKVATDFAQALDQMIIHGTNMPQSIHQNPKLRSLKLMFLGKVYVPVFTGKEIKRVGVEIVVLRGDFGGDGRDNWTTEEFDSSIVCDREDVNKPLFSGTVHIRLNRGIGLIDKIKFSHYTNYMKTNVFCLGARVIESFNGTRLKEAKTEPFTVKDARVAAMQRDQRNQKGKNASLQLLSITKKRERNELQHLSNTKKKMRHSRSTDNSAESSEDSHNPSID
ncbi:hypothetical protein RDI58_013772 [Solanum bulbocastanum]|uniref:Calmodulin binding protein-like N-terminal domain-containing protein n=1 Tax=Solanum bulbocastanum TaxID=147425 RepID=A0AAN8YEZ7_SOLBU